MIVRNEKGRPLYTMRLEYDEFLEKNVVRSSLPDELLLLSGRDILSLIPNKISCEAEVRILEMLVNRLNNFPITNFFYLPDLVIYDCDVEPYVMAEYNKLCDSLDDPCEHVYSDYFNPLWFEAMRFQFNRAQFLRLHEFHDEVIQISKLQFQKAIKTQQAAGQYVRFLNLQDRNNIFYCIEEHGYTAYLMATGLELNLILILHSNGEN